MKCTESKFDSYPRVGHCINITKQMGNGRNVHRVLISSYRCQLILSTGGWQCWSCKMLSVGAKITFVCSTSKAVNQNLLDPNLL